MGTIEFVALVIRFHNKETKQWTKSVEGFKLWIQHQTVAEFNGQTLYYYGDVTRYLLGPE